MSASIETLQEVTVITLADEHLDASNVEEFRADLEPVLSRSRKVVLDFGQVTFVDSSGMGAIISALKRLATAGGDLRICNLTPQVKSLFELVRLHKLCQILDTRDAAVQSFAS